MYEYPVKNVSVMMRKKDHWVNATHILKVANFDKPQRTRILERDVQKGVHEKVQGGYGKYQGTWVPLDRARQIAGLYDVLGDLEPLFGFEPGSESPPQLPRGRPKPAAPRAPAGGAGGAAGVAAGRGGGDWAAMHSPTLQRASMGGAGAPGAAGELKRKRGRPPTRRLTPPPQVAAPRAPVARNDYAPDSASVSSRSSSPSDFMSDSDIDAALADGSRPYRKQHQPQTLATTPGSAGRYYQRSQLSTPTTAHTAQFAAPQSQQQRAAEADATSEYNNKLLDYFMTPDDDTVPEVLVHPPPGFKINQVIDDEGHTAFHWACAMGHLKIIEILLNAGADTLAENNLGHTPLIRAIMFTNNFDRRTFPKVVDLLRSTLFHMDTEKRTLFHHIAATTSSRSKLASARYYTEIALAKISESQGMQVVADFINRQDANGDTALHIAARNGAKKCVKVLLSYQAVTNIVNAHGRTAKEYIDEYEAQKYQARGDHGMHGVFKSSSSPNNNMDAVYMDSSSGRAPPGVQANGPGATAAPNGYGQQKYLLHATPGHNTQSSFYGGGATADGSGSGHAVHHAYPTVGTPHVSEAAIQASQRVAPAIANLLEELANAYDTELKDKDADVEQVRQLLENVKQDIAATESAIPELQKRFGDESQASAKLHASNELVKTRAVQLRKLIERSQARDLAMIVQEEEAKVKDEIQRQMQAGEEFSPKEVMALARELIALQGRRKKYADEVMELCANAGVGEKISEYRRLLAQSCNLQPDEIDMLLDSITEELAERADDE